MLVPNMSLPERKKFILQDYEKELKRKIEQLQIIHKRDWIKNNRQNSVKTIHYKTESNNLWHFIIECTKVNAHVTPYFSYYDEKGITASHLATWLDPSPFMHFSTHFFKRFRERMNLNIVKPEELVKYFFRKNTYLVPANYRRKDGTYQLFAPLYGGVGLGNYHEQDDFFEFKTFIDDNRLTKWQIARVLVIYRGVMRNFFSKQIRGD
jgi:hypothetical protein